MRLGIALRLLGVLALGALVAIDGAAIKNRAIGSGEFGQYTVVLKPGVDASLASDHHAKAYDVKIDKAGTNASMEGYVAAIPVDRLDKVRSDSDVSYLIKDNVSQTKQHWWDDVLITFGLRTPQFN